MKKQWLLILGMLPLVACAQTKDTLILTDGPVHPQTELAIYPSAILSQQPLFPGGERAMKRWCLRHTHYNQAKAESGMEGKVYCEVTIDSLGKIRDPEITRPVGYEIHPWLEEETVRLILKMPPFSPGKYGNMTVNTRYIFSFYYKRNTEKNKNGLIRSGEKIYIYPKE